MLFRSSTLIEPYQTGCVRDTETDRKKVAQREQQIDSYNKGARDLPQLETGDVIRMGEKSWEKKGVVEGRVNDRSYRVRTEDGGQYRRNRRDLLKVGEKYRPRPVVETELNERVRIEEKVDEAMEALKRQVAEMEKELDLEEEVEPVEQTPEALVGQGAEPPQLRRSSRVGRPVDRLNLLVSADDPGSVSETSQDSR